MTPPLLNLSFYDVLDEECIKKLENMDTQNCSSLSAEHQFFDNFRSLSWVRYLFLVSKPSLCCSSFFFLYLQPPNQSFLIGLLRENHQSFLCFNANIKKQKFDQKYDNIIR